MEFYLNLNQTLLGITGTSFSTIFSTTFSTSFSTVTILGLFSLRYWGAKIDENGTYSTIRISSLAIAIFPLFWMGIFYLPAQLVLPSAIVIASMASLMFSGRALALDNRLYEHMQNKGMIKITSKRVFYRGLSIFLGGLMGGLLTRDELGLSSLPCLGTTIHAVMIFSTLLRLFVWFGFLRSKETQI